MLTSMSPLSSLTTLKGRGKLKAVKDIRQDYIIDANGTALLLNTEAQQAKQPLLCLGRVTWPLSVSNYDNVDVWRNGVERKRKEAYKTSTLC